MAAPKADITFSVEFQWFKKGVRPHKEVIKKNPNNNNNNMYFAQKKKKKNEYEILIKYSIYEIRY